MCSDNKQEMCSQRGSSPSTVARLFIFCRSLFLACGVIFGCAGNATSALQFLSMLACTGQDGLIPHQTTSTDNLLQSPLSLTAQNTTPSCTGEPSSRLLQYCQSSTGLKFLFDTVYICRSRYTREFAVFNLLAQLHRVPQNLWAFAGDNTLPRSKGVAAATPPSESNVSMCLQVKNAFTSCEKLVAGP